MRGLRRRVRQLEQERGTTHQGVQVLFTYEGVEFALDYDRCTDILAEAGFVRSGPGVSVLDFSTVPHGLSAVELELYLRTRGQEICFPKPCGYLASAGSRL